MTTITIKNPNNFSLATLKKVLQSLDIEVVKIESEEPEEIPTHHLESIQKGLEELKQGFGKDSSEIRGKAREINNAIQEGIDSGIAEGFDPKKHLQALKTRLKSNG